MRLIAGVILASVVAPTLTVGSSAGCAFQMIVSIDDEDEEGGLKTLVTLNQLCRNQLLIITNDLDWN